MTTGGIILPSELRKSNIGTVAQSGISLVKTGSKVALDEEQIMEIEVEGKKYASVKEDAILMITK